jgi:pyruvyl transferase EpsO
VLPLRALLSRTYDPAARRRLGRAVALLSGADVVVTDRLHGHVLALLLGIPHVLLDDRTGKVHALHATWTRDVAGVRAARDPAEALLLARTLRDEPSARSARG